MRRITAYLLYADVAAALEPFASAFGFRERMQMPKPEGKNPHAEMELADDVIIMGNRGADHRNPKRVGHVTLHLCVYDHDAEANFEHARKAGTTILEEPRDQFYGDRR